MNLVKRIKQILGTKNTLSNVFWFSLFGFLQPAINIFLLPLYMQNLSPKEYGILALVLVFTSIVSVFAGIRLDTAVRTFYFDYNSDENKLWNYISQVFTFVLTISLIFGLLLSIVGPFLFDLIFDSELILFYPYGIISISTVILTSISSVYFIYLKNQINLKSFFFYNLLSTLVTIASQVYLILFLNMKILGVLYGSLAASSIVMILIVANNPSLINFKWQKKILLPSIMFSLPLIPLSILLVIGKQIDKVILERFMELSQVGVYTVLMTLIGVVGVLNNALGNGVRPFLYQSISNGGKEAENASKLFKSLYLFVGLIALSGVILIGSNIDTLTSNEAYQRMSQYILWAVLASIPIILVRYLNLILVFYKKSKSLTLGVFIQVLIAIVLMIITIPIFGIYGAIGSIGISQIINFLVFKNVVDKIENSNLTFKDEYIRIGLFTGINLICFILLRHINLGVFGIVQFVLIFFLMIVLDNRKIFQLIKVGAQ